MNRHQYGRDIERRDKKIAELEAQLKAADAAAARLAEEMVSGAQELFVADLTRELARRLEADCANPDVLATLPRVSREAAMGVWARWRGRVTERCRRAFEEALAREDDDVSRELARAYPVAASTSDTGAGANALAEAARGMAAVIARDNVAFCDDAARRYATAVADAVARVDAGGSREEEMGRACRALADLGTVDYRSGVRTQLDAAIRRHVVTQANQARNDLLARRMDECGCDLVFVSSHWGCRPTHEWFQGRVFSRSGANAGKVVADASGRRVTVGRLSDTGYGTAAGLCGANCGHVMYPFSPGDTELPDREFASQGREFGRTGAEQYALTQRQRALERRVRAAKREAAAAREAGADDVPARLALGRAQAELRAFCSENRLTRMPGRERAYGVGAQPRALRRDPLSSVVGKARLGASSGGVVGGRMKRLGSINMGNKDELREAVRQCKDSIRRLEVEHAWVIQADGSVLHSVGTPTGVSLEGAELDGAVVIHNHPLVDGFPMSFGADDFMELKRHPGIKRLWALSGDYEYEVSVLRPLDISYNEAYRKGGDYSSDEDIQHNVMEWLSHEGYVDYRRHHVSPDQRAEG
ncbi:MAG: phage minor capsid protein [Coriobacteriales bacterium]